MSYGFCPPFLQQRSFLFFLPNILNGVGDKYNNSADTECTIDASGRTICTRGNEQITFGNGS